MIMIVFTPYDDYKTCTCYWFTSHNICYVYVNGTFNSMFNDQKYLKGTIYNRPITIVPLSFWHLFDDLFLRFFHFGSKISFLKMTYN